jgi:hypothetical protein
MDPLTEKAPLRPRFGSKPELGSGHGARKVRKTSTGDARHGNSLFRGITMQN